MAVHGYCGEDDLHESRRRWRASEHHHILWYEVRHRAETGISRAEHGTAGAAVTHGDDCLITWDPASFSLPVDAAGRPAHQLQGDMTYFSLVTLATVGYGDVLPVTNTARMLAMFHAVVRQFYVAVVVALFVGMYSAKSRG